MNSLELSIQRHLREAILYFMNQTNDLNLIYERIDAVYPGKTFQTKLVVLQMIRNNEIVVTSY